MIFAAAFYFIFDLNSKTGDTVIIKVNGQIYDEVSLNEEKDIEIYLDDGIHSNTVRIKDKKAFMLYANCPDGFCLKHRPLGSDANTNDMIVCLPNRVTVEIKNDNKNNNKYDIVIKNNY